MYEASTLSTFLSALVIVCLLSCILFSHLGEVELSPALVILHSQFSPTTYCGGGFPGGSLVKNPRASAGHGSLIPGKRKWQPTTVFLPGKSHGPRSLGGYSPWGCKSLTQLSD